MENRLAEVPHLSLAALLSSLSYALDLTGGNPMGHAQRSCLIAMRLGTMLGLSESQMTALYYGVLMKDCGCSSNAARMFEIFGTDEIIVKSAITVVDKTNLVEAARFIAANAAKKKSVLARALRTLDIAAHPEGFDEIIETRCDRGFHIALALGLGEEAARCIYGLMERWDGRGGPNGLSREQIPILARVAGVAQQAEVLSRTYGLCAALDIIRKRAGKWLDPAVVKALQQIRDDTALWSAVAGDPRDALLALDIQPAIETATQERIDLICDAFAQIVDAKSPFTAEHSRRVCTYSILIGGGLDFDADRLTTLRRAALLHDIGKLAVPNSILDKPGRLTDEEWQIVRRHPFHTHEILCRIPGFARLTEIAAAHHERLDGKGYYQGLEAGQLDADMRIVAVADVFDALSAHRPYREALEPSEVFAIMGKEAGSALDVDCFEVLKDRVEQTPISPFTVEQPAEQQTAA